MAITYVDDSGLVTSTAGSVTPTLPTGWAADDFLCMHVVHGSTTAMTPPGVWQLGDSVAFNATHTIHMMWKFAGAGESNPTFPGTTTNGIWGVLSAYRGVPVRLDPFDVDPVAAAVTPSGGAIPGATMTTTTANAMAVWLYSQSDNSTTSTASNSATVAYSGSAYDSIVGIDSSQAAAYKLIGAFGATGATNMTASSGAASAAIRFALNATPLPVDLPPMLRPEHTRFRHLLPR